MRRGQFRYQLARLQPDRAPDGISRRYDLPSDAVGPRQADRRYGSILHRAGVAGVQWPLWALSDGALLQPPEDA